MRSSVGVTQQAGKTEGPEPDGGVSFPSFLRMGLKREVGRVNDENMR
jgi:hypothetical protein